MSTFILLPGAGGSPWIWSRVAPILEQAGHQAIAVDLPAADPTAGLPEYVERVQEAIGTSHPSAGDRVLVAQSLGGFTAAMVAARLPVAAIVFVNAMIPLPGERAADWWANTGSAEALEAAAAAGGYGAFDVETYFFHDVAPEIFAEAGNHQRDEADIAFESPCDFEAWPDVPKYVLTGADDRLFPERFQRRVARDRIGVEADVLAGGHLMALSQPALVAGYLLAHQGRPT